MHDLFKVCSNHASFKLQWTSDKTLTATIFKKLQFVVHTRIPDTCDLEIT